jgi:hypothetical protein
METMVVPNRLRVVALMLALALAGGLLALALLAKPTLAQEEGATSEQFPVNFIIEPSECTSEAMEVTGTLHTVNHFTAQPDGTYHVNSHFNLQNAKAVGLTSGTTYVIPASGSAVENFVQSGQIVTGTVDISLIIGKGQIPNRVAVLRVHYIISAEGEVKVETVQAHLECH